MQAIDIMTPNVVSVGPDTEVRDIAQLLLKHRISAVPVVDEDRQLVGIVSEGDLMRRIKDEGDHRDAWWLTLFAGGKDAGDYVKSHGRKAHEVMTANPLSVAENTPLHTIARMLEKHHIKRVPVLREGKLVGIVSRANLLQGIANAAVAPTQSPTDDRQIREAILKEVENNTGVQVEGISVIVDGGAVEVWGLVESHEQKQAVSVAAENVPGVTKVENHLGMIPRGVGYM
ncbi:MULTISPECIES: CBS domain-containing protein [unclassified Halomonas]|uniref:CBS domain-containing protein n=1 Tax=unclassified Halomonas TaxID=2609666 RepID=UPI001CF2CAB1|nr:MULTISPECIES: CBS domain-containing protein [unclassified Halomonas]MCA8863907.1 CBS domain-containing protein [Halomonas sp. SBBP1]UZH11151.1 CBS domain-containing protein [Halomonas sp. BDJS001]